MIKKSMNIRAWQLLESIDRGDKIDITVLEKLCKEIISTYQQMKDMYSD